MRILSLRWLGTNTRYCWVGLGMGGLALSVLLLLPMRVWGEHHVTVTGQVVNGTSGGAIPAEFEVTLHTITEAGEVGIATALVTGDGRFRFPDVQVDDGFTYAVAASYRDVLYSTRLDPSALEEPVELTIYETTNNLEVLRVDADVLLITRTDPGERSLSAAEVVRLVNLEDRTFVPDLTQPGSMSFLRFSIPAGQKNLEVLSDLPGGEIITVGTGFALTAPVTPGFHQVTYTYLVPYDGSRLELTRSFPMGAEVFRLLLEDTLGNIKASAQLTPQSATGEEGNFYRVWGASQLAPGTRLDVEIYDLPQPALLRRIGGTLADGSYLKIGIPGAVGLVMAALLVHALASRQRGRGPATNPGGGDAVLSTASAAGEPGNPIEGSAALWERR